MSKIRRVSWKNKAEWTGVYQGAFASELTQVEGAVRQMKIWVARGLCPGGVKCTLDLLQSACQDSSFFHELPADRALPDLQLQYAYSSGIMRFLNVLYETHKDDSLTLYGKAKLIGLEDWLVHIRHLTAHGQQLPSLDFLRLGVSHTLEWLKENYWEVEKEASEDLVTRKSLKEMHFDKLTGLLTLFTQISEELLQDRKTINRIVDVEIKKSIETGVNSLSELSVQTIPWQANNEKIARSRIQSRDLNKVSSFVCKTMKPYFKRREIAAQSCSILIDFLIRDHFRWHKIRLDVFALLFKKFHSWRTLVKLIEILVDRTFPRIANRVESTICGDWLVALLKALVKRFRVEELLKILRRESKGRRSAKIRARLTPDERGRLVRNITKKRLSIETGQSMHDVKVLAILMQRVERKNPALKPALRLREAVVLTNKTVLDLLYKACREPNSFTPSVVDLLTDLLTFRRLVTKKHLKSLVNLYSGHEREGRDRGAVKWKIQGVESLLNKPFLAYADEMTDGSESEHEDNDPDPMPEESLWIAGADGTWGWNSSADRIPQDVLNKINEKDAIRVEYVGKTSLSIVKSWTDSCGANLSFFRLNEREES